MLIVHHSSFIANPMLDNFFTDILQKAGSRVAAAKHSVSLLLDKNEQADDLDFAFKKKVVERLLNTNWNRYPNADNREIETKVAEYSGLAPENIAISPGSASIITTLLNYFAINKKRIVITQPSYSLFDYHCNTYNIPYEAWHLTADLEYDYQNMPVLGANSVLIITSPNNPVGNTMDVAKLEHLLTTNPGSYVILDAVYCEFGDVDVTPLVKKHPNLIVLRSFSKAFPVAGLRLGYLCASPETAAIVKKLVLQFSLNHFTQVFAREMLADPAFMAAAKKRVRDIIAERERMHRLINRRFGSAILHAYRSEGNFLLVRVHERQAFENLMADLAKQGIKVLNTSGVPLLENTFRVSIGTPQENETFFHCMKTSLERSAQPVRASEPVFHPRAVRLSQPVQVSVATVAERGGVVLRERFIGLQKPGQIQHRYRHISS